MFHSRQRDALIWVTYEGGAVLFGTLVGKAGSEGKLDFHYQHINERGKFMTGECESRLQVLKDGRYRLHESWRWTSWRLFLGALRSRGDRAPTDGVDWSDPDEYPCPW